MRFRQVSVEAAGPLVASFSASLEEARLFCLPSTLQQCRSLRRLEVLPSPDKPADGQVLREVLRLNKSLQHLAFLK